MDIYKTKAMPNLQIHSDDDVVILVIRNKSKQIYKLYTVIYSSCIKNFFYCKSVSHSVMSDSLQPYGTSARQAPLSMEFSRQEYWSE